MTPRTLVIPDGTVLVGCPDDPTRWIDPQTDHTVEWDAGRSALVDGEKVVREVVPAAAATNTSRSRPRPRAKSSSSSSAKQASRERFATFNAFVDTVARHLSPVEVVVWTIMFRDCRDGTASTSSRDLARRSGCSLRAVVNAVQRLRASGLITAVKLSTHKGQPSVYAVHPEPDRMVPAIVNRTQRTGARGAPVANP